MSILQTELVIPFFLLLFTHCYSLWLIFIAWKKPNKIKAFHIFELGNELREKIAWRIKVFGPLFSLFSLVLAVSMLVLILGY